MAGELTAQELAELDADADPRVLLNVIERLVAELGAVREQLGQAQIRRLFCSMGVQVSAGYVAGLLTNTEEFAAHA